MQPLEKSLGILGISKTASLTELKAAYRFRKFPPFGSDCKTLLEKTNSFAIQKIAEEKLDGSFYKFCFETKL